MSFLSRIQVDHLTIMKQLNVERDEVEEILIDLILEGKVQGRIDQVGMRLEIDRQYVISILTLIVPQC